MRTTCVSIIMGVAALLFGSFTALAANPEGETFNFSKSGVASVRVGADYTAIPVSCLGLYSRVEFDVACGSECGDGIAVMCYDDSNSTDYVINAQLDLNDAAVDAIYEEGLDCNTFPITDTKVINLLKKYGATRVGAVTVASSPHITVNIGGQEIATSEPAVKFMALPGAVTTVTLGEGLIITCTVGELTMEIMDPYDALLDSEAVNDIYQKLASALETGVFEAVPLSPADVNPEVRFDTFYY